MSPIFSVGTISANQPFLTPNPDVVSFGLSECRAHKLWFGDRVMIAVHSGGLRCSPNLSSKTFTYEQMVSFLRVEVLCVFFNVCNQCLYLLCLDGSQVLISTGWMTPFAFVPIAPCTPVLPCTCSLSTGTRLTSPL